MPNSIEQKKPRSTEAEGLTEESNELEFLGEAPELSPEDAEEVRDLEEKLETEVFVDEAAVERVSAQIANAELINRFENAEELNDGERKKLAEKISKKGWFGVLNNLNAGDKVAYFNAPGGEFAIKRLNDVYFGNQITDDIWTKRNEVLTQKMNEAGADMLRADYKSGVFKSDKLSVEDLNAVATAVDHEMTDFIIQKISERKQEIDGLELPLEEIHDMNERLSELQDKLEKFGFVMSFGVGEVGVNDNVNDKSEAALAVARASEAALSDRPRQPGEYGKEFDDSILNKELEGIFGEEGLAKKIDGEYGSLTAWPGEVYKIFDKDEQGIYKLNRDLARLVRKNKIVPVEQKDKEALDLVGAYMRRINLIDLVRPNTAEELSGAEVLPSGRNLAEEAQMAQEISGKLLNNEQMSPEERAQAVKFLNSDNKDSRFNSWEVFHAKAVDIEDCAYVSLDVKDLGVDLLLGYEQAMQQMHGATTEEQKAIVLSAGDDMTKRMREVRGIAADLYQEHFGEAPLVLVGGDEMTMAFSMREDVEDFMVELQKRTNSRVIHTVVSEAERHNGDVIKDEKEIIARHLRALKKVEDGAAMAKELEVKKQKIENMLSKKGFDMSSIGDILIKNGLGNVVIKEVPSGGFEAISGTAEARKKMPVKEAVKIFDQVLEDITKGDIV